MQREYDGDPIDMTWDNGPWANDGETIDATNDTNGTMKTIDWPDDATDPEELNEDQRAVIRAAARNPDAKSMKEIKDIAATEKTRQYVADTLQRHWRKKHSEYSGPSHGTALSDREVDKVRIALLNGEDQSWLQDHFGVSQTTILSAAKGIDHYHDVSCKTPPLKHTTGNLDGEWVTEDAHETADDTDTGIDPDTTPRFKDPVAAATADALRKRVLNGENAVDIAEENPKTPCADISRILRGDAIIDGSPTEPELEFNRGRHRWEPQTDDERIDAADQADDDIEAEADDTADDTDADAEPDADDTDREPADIGWNPQPRQRQSNSKAIAALTAVVAIVAYLLGKRR